MKIHKITEASEHLGVSINTLKTLANNNKINSFKTSGSTMQRLQKYFNKGYWICNGGILEIAQAINKLDLSDPEQNNIEYYPDGTPRFVRID